MSEEMFVRHCAPTLAGLKTANLFSCGFENINQMTESVRKINRKLSGKGLRFVPLKYSGGNALLYLYRPERLKTDLCRNAARALLCECGYSPESPGRCISSLRKRLSESDNFPHEIGLFLGYPPEDVRGFMELGARKCKCSGCWKVYGDENAARITFEKHKKCKAVYCRRHADGIPVERLAVSSKKYK